MNTDKYRQFLLDHIKPVARSASGGTEINCRCFYCPDSKDPTHAHMYISIPRDNKPSQYYCMKCSAHGLVTHERLLEWGLYDANISVDLINYNKMIMKLPQNKKFKGNGFIYNIKNKVITEDELSLYKLKRINNRLGVNLTFKDCIDLKIVLNLKDLLSSNRLSYTRHENIVNQLDSNFLGFLSYDNAFLNMRNLEIGEVYKGINKRYVNYNVFDKFDNSTRFYVIPTQVNLEKPINLYIAEGPFDILSIYLNLIRSLDNNIFVAAEGSGYKGIVRYFLSTAKLVNIENIHIYADKDINDNVIYDIANLISFFQVNLYLHRNIFENEKDYGVSINKINDYTERIL